ncbi:MAG: (2Fe-2S)-binding protein [Acidimicrobiales bacterium]
MVVCHCRALNDAAIVELVNSGRHTVDALVAACGAGGDCGGCRPVLEELVAAVATPVGVRAGSVQSAA